MRNLIIIGLFPFICLSQTIMGVVSQEKSLLPAINDTDFSGASGLKTWIWSEHETEINGLTQNDFIDGNKLFTSTHHYGDSPIKTPVTVIGEEVQYQVTPRTNINSTATPAQGESIAYNYRAELNDTPTDANHPDGTDIWFGTYYRFPADYIPDERTFSIWQTHDDASLPAAPIQMGEIASTDYGNGTNARGELVIANSWDFTNGNTSRVATGFIPQAGQKFKFVVHLVIGSTPETSVYRVWVDDVLVADVNEPTTFAEYATGGYMKWGIYKWSWKNDSSISVSEGLGITDLTIYTGAVRIIRWNPTDEDYRNDTKNYELVDPENYKI